MKPDGGKRGIMRFLAIASLVLIPCFAQQTQQFPGGLAGTSFGAPFGTVRKGMGYRAPETGRRGAYRGRQLVPPLYVGVPLYGGFYGPDYYDVPPPPPHPPAPNTNIVINQNFVPERANPLTIEVPPSGVSSETSGPTVFQAPGPPPVETVSSEDSASQSSDEPTVYLIALRDHTIVPALAYWVDGKTLKYVNMDHAIREAPLNQVDRGFSLRLNEERNVDFHLPAR